MKLTETAPPACSSCFAQKPGLRHVDFESAWDGPTLDVGTEHERTLRTQIDELIICEECLIQAAKLVDLGDVGAAAAHATDLERQLAEVSERLAGAVDHIERLEGAQVSAVALRDRLAGPARESQTAKARKRPAAKAA